MKARISDDRGDVLAVLTTVGGHLPEMPQPERLARAINRMVSDGAYRFFLVDDGPGSAVRACGVVTLFAVPMAEDHVVAVEDLWLSDDEPAILELVLRLLTDFAQGLDFAGVVLPESATNVPDLVKDLARCGTAVGYPISISRFWLQSPGNTEPVGSAVSDEPVGSALFRSVPLLAIAVRKQSIDVEGVEYDGDGPLYRGESRLIRPGHWNCRDLDELVVAVRAAGVDTRRRELPADSAQPFGGTIAEQLLHQGYVGQGAVSLSTSFEVAAWYATRGGAHPNGVVMTVDPMAIRSSARLFDAERTFERACPWLPLSAWDSFTRIVAALRYHLDAAGTLMNTVNTLAWERAQVGAGSLIPWPDITSRLPAKTRAVIASTQLDPADLAAVCRTFEEFAELAAGKVGAVDEIHIAQDGSHSERSHRVGPMAYFEIFQAISGPLEGARPDWQVGWDTTPYGYIAKTFRDAEVFSSGRISADAIVACYEVGPSRSPLREISLTT